MYLELRNKGRRPQARGGNFAIVDRTNALLDAAYDEEPRIEVVDLGPVRGRGIVAAGDSPRNRLLEIAPAIIVNGAETDDFRPYLFTSASRDLPGDLAAHEHAAPYFVVFGRMSLANHADTPNCAVTFHYAAELGLWAALHSLTGVRAGDELTIRYPDRQHYDF